MPAFLITWALKAGIPQRYAKAAIIAALVVLAVIAFVGAKALYDHRVIANHEAKVEVKQARREEKADANLYKQKEADTAASVQRKQEIDDATKGIPDQAPSTRQRARVCVELRRQGVDNPACRSADPR